MPTDYQCRHCGLQFAVGAFRYREREIQRKSTYLVCRACGTWHMVQHAVDRRGRDWLLAQPHPQIGRPKVNRAPLIPAEIWGVVDEVAVSRARQAALLNRALRALSRFPARYASLSCGHCQSTGTLVIAVRGPVCPHCKQPALEQRLSYAR